MISQFALTCAALAVTPQQQRMKDCNAEATQKNLTGQERKDFMKSCLSAKQAEAKAARTAQREKMKTCNAEASKQGLKADKRKAFMSECLKG
ncbi:MAG: PsiF family protein [Rhodocyclaceae bacterium]